MSLWPLLLQLEDTVMTPGATSLWRGGYWAAYSPSTGLCQQFHLLSLSVSPKSEQNTNTPLLL